MLVNEIRKISEQNSYKLIKENIYKRIKQEAENGNYMCIIEENSYSDNVLSEKDISDIQNQGFKISLKIKE